MHAVTHFLDNASGLTGTVGLLALPDAPALYVYATVGDTAQEGPSWSERIVVDDDYAAALADARCWYGLYVYKLKRDYGMERIDTVTLPQAA